MPKIKNRLKHKGYISPAPGKIDNKHKKILSKVYGECRVKNPGEIKENKKKCAKIAWSVVKKIK